MSKAKKKRNHSLLSQILRIKTEKKNRKKKSAVRRSSSGYIPSQKKREQKRLTFAESQLKELQIKKANLITRDVNSSEIKDQVQTLLERISVQELESQKLKLEFVFIQNSQKNFSIGRNEKREPKFKKSTDEKDERYQMKETKIKKIVKLEKEIKKLKTKTQKAKYQDWFVIEKKKLKEQTVRTNSLLNDLALLKFDLIRRNKENDQIMLRMKNSKDGNEKRKLQNQGRETHWEESQNLDRRIKKLQFDLKNMSAIKTNFVRILRRSKDLEVKIKLETYQSRKLENQIGELKEYLDLQENELTLSDFDNSTFLFDSSDSDTQKKIPVSRFEIENTILSQNSKMKMTETKRRRRNIHQNVINSSVANNNNYKAIKIGKMKKRSSKSMGLIERKTRNKLNNSNAFLTINCQKNGSEKNNKKKKKKKKNSLLGSKPRISFQNSFFNLKNKYNNKKKRGQGKGKKKKKGKETNLNFNKDIKLSSLTKQNSPKDLRLYFQDDTIVELKKKKKSLLDSDSDEKEKLIDLNSLEMLLRIPTAVSYFTEFLSQQLNSENILFFQAVKNYKRNCHNKKQIKKTANSIAKKYIYPGSFFEINIISETRKKIIKCIENQNYTLDLFDNAQKAVYKHMDLNSWNSFLENSLYKNLMIHLNKSSNIINLKQKKCTLVKNQNKKLKSIYCLNEERIYQITSRNSLSVIETLTIQIFDLFNSYYQVSNGQINLKLISQSIPYRRFVQFTSELQNIKLVELATDKEKNCFFLNLFNCLAIHSFIENGIPKDKATVDKFMKNSIYKIQGLHFSLHDIYHGILRANHDQKHLNNYFKNDDPRKKYAISALDPRIHFGIINFYFPTHLRIYTKKNLYTLLNKVTLATLSPIVKIQSKFIFLPKIFGLFEKDFGGTNVLMDWISHNLKENINIQKNHVYSVKFSYKSISSPTFFFDIKSTLVRKFQI
ncbi:hypothetical protein M0813_26859 [Anaeramoeba flamelloides]|uniref:RGS domain-containing protein n=1 Tax=Anaeramoeba flamelloides TaxID=1746091 RepID=A0ABQ8XZD9_9EUKA|nr:hypothetical protein M0813_26859 [Anaeramoeba flamelloides]